MPICVEVCSSLATIRGRLISHFVVISLYEPVMFASVCYCQMCAFITLIKGSSWVCSEAAIICFLSRRRRRGLRSELSDASPSFL